MLFGKRVVLIFLGILYVTSACQPEQSITVMDKPVPTQQQSGSASGINFTLDQTTFENSPSEISTKLTNTTDTSCSYGDFFRIEFKQDGLWYQVKYAEDVFDQYPNFVDVGSIIEPNRTVVQDFSLNRLNMSLPDGQYRLLKTVFCPLQQAQEITVSIPFNVGQ